MHEPTHENPPTCNNSPAPSKTHLLDTAGRPRVMLFCVLIGRKPVLPFRVVSGRPRVMSVPVCCGGAGDRAAAPGGEGSTSYGIGALETKSDASSCSRQKKGTAVTCRTRRAAPLLHGTCSSNSMIMRVMQAGWGARRGAGATTFGFLLAHRYVSFRQAA